MCEICLTVSSYKIILVCAQCTVIMISFELFPHNRSLFDSSDYFIITLFFVDHYLLLGCVGERGRRVVYITSSNISLARTWSPVYIHVRDIGKHSFYSGWPCVTKNYLEKEEENS